MECKYCLKDVSKLFYTRKYGFSCYKCKCDNTNKIICSDCGEELKNFWRGTRCQSCYRLSKGYTKGKGQGYRNFTIKDKQIILETLNKVELTKEDLNVLNRERVLIL